MLLSLLLFIQIQIEYYDCRCEKIMYLINEDNKMKKLFIVEYENVHDDGLVAIPGNIGKNHESLLQHRCRAQPYFSTIRYKLICHADNQCRHNVFIKLFQNRQILIG